MISFSEAYETVIRSAILTGSESVPFTDSLGRILAEDVESDIDMPPFNRSAVDGYACHRSDLKSEMEVVEVIPAGKIPQQKVGGGQCSKIMTGAIVPTGCDLVFMVEDSVKLGSGKVAFTGSESKVNMALKGEDAKAGDTILNRSRLIRPQDIAVMASVGRITVKVGRKPSVGILSTGDELVEPEKTPDNSHIRNSNAWQLMAQVARAGGEAGYYGIAPDSESITLEMIRKALDEKEIVILTGGVSMGDYDFVPSVMKRAGVRILFDKINIQPGKPTTFGIRNKTAVFGLPGNPVSSFIQFETLVRPLINQMMGCVWKPVIRTFPMAVKFERKSATRAGWIPVKITGDRLVLPVNYHGSAHITSIPDADGIIAISVDKTIIDKGEIVDVREI